MINQPADAVRPLLRRAYESGRQSITEQNLRTEFEKVCARIQRLRERGCENFRVKLVHHSVPGKEIADRQLADRLVAEYAQKLQGADVLITKKVKAVAQALNEPIVDRPIGVGETDGSHNALSTEGDICALLLDDLPASTGPKTPRVG